MVNAVSMDNVEHAYAVQQLRKSGKNAKIVSSTLMILEPDPYWIVQMNAEYLSVLISVYWLT